MEMHTNLVLGTVVKKDSYAGMICGPEARTMVPYRRGYLGEVAPAGEIVKLAEPLKLTVILKRNWIFS
jgi:hypothetical protein